MQSNKLFGKITRKLRWFLVDFLVKIGWQPKLNRSKGEVRVLVFHGVCGNEESFINGRFMHLEQLDFLLAGISKNFHPIHMDDFQRGKLNDSKLNILCTFDDGYKNNLDLALKIFEKHQVPFTVFCNAVPYHLMDLLDISQTWQAELLDELKTQFQLNSTTNELKNHCKNESLENVRNMSDFLWKRLNPELKEKSKRFWEVLSDGDLVLLNHSSLVSFGNHGAFHLNYVHLSEHEILEDLQKVTDRLNALNIKTASFAYPYGEYSNATISALQKAGFVMQFSDNPKETNQKIKGRFTINPFISLQNQLIAIDKGKY